MTRGNSVTNLRSLPFAFATVALFSLPAAADEATEAFLKSWVASIDSAPGWDARFAAVATDASGTTTLTNFVVTSEKPGFELSIAAIGVSGYDAGANALFAADTVTINGGKVKAGDALAVALDDVALSGLALPPASDFVWDGDRPYLGLVKAFSAFSQISMASATIGTFVLDQTYEGERSTTTYTDVELTNWSDGKIASITSGPIEATTPSDQTLVAMRIAGAESNDIDLGAMVRILDPDQYAGGKGDMVWHTILGRTVYNDMIMAFPGVTVRISEAFNENFQMRQPEGGIEAFLDLGMPGSEEKYEKPEEAAKLVQALRAFGIGRVGLTNLDVEAEGIERAHLDSLTLADFSFDRLGEFSFDGIDVSVPGQGSAKVGRVAIGDLIFPPMEALMAIAAAEDAGQDPDVSAAMPKLGFFEAAAVSVDIQGVVSAALEKMRLDLGNYVGPVPTSVSLEVVDADLPIEVIEEADARQVLEALGYERVRIDAGLKVDWSEAGELNIGEYRVGIRDAGVISGDARLSGLTPAEYELLEDPAVLSRLLFHGGSLSILDQSIVSRGVALQAGMTGTNPDEFRQTFVMGLPYMLTFLGNPDLIKQVVPILQAFVRTDGGSVTAVSNPPEPIPFMDLAEAAEDPIALYTLLGVQFSGTAGTEPAPAAATDAPAEAPATDDPNKDNSTKME